MVGFITSHSLMFQLKHQTNLKGKGLKCKRLKGEGLNVKVLNLKARGLSSLTDG